jgi:hypothetical protein
MRIPVAEAAKILEERGSLQRRRKDQSDRIIEFVRGMVGRELPQDLIDFYRERIDGIGQFTAQVPGWNPYTGYGDSELVIAPLLPVDAVPLFDDGCGSLYGLDLTPGVEAPAVYFFDHEDGYERPRWTAGSSLGAFLLLLPDTDRSCQEDWPEKWELRIDPDIDKCPRARAIWAAG